MRNLHWLLVLGVAGCSTRAELPAASLPLTPTLDAAFRAAPPQPLVHAGDWIPPAHEERVLENGMRLIVAPRRALPMVTVVYVNRRAGLLPPGFPADVASLTGDMLAQGFWSEGRQPIENVQVAGRSLVAVTGLECTAVSWSGVKEGLGPALSALARSVRAPLLTQETMTEAKRNQLRSIYQQMRSSDGLLLPLRLELMFGPEHRWVMSRSAWAEQLQGIRAEDVMRFHEAVYRPEHSGLIVVGDAEPGEVAGLFEQAFASWQPPPAEPLATIDTHTRVGERHIYAVLSGGATAQVRLLHPLPSAGPQDLPALGVLRHVLAKERLTSSLRHAEGHTYFVGGSVHLFEHGGFMEIALDVENRRVGLAVRAIVEQLERARTQAFSQSEVETAKSAFLEELLPPSNPALADQLVRYEVLGLPATALGEMVEKVLALTGADLHEAANQHLAHDRVSILTLGNFYEFDADFFELGRVEKFQRGPSH